MEYVVVTLDRGTADSGKIMHDFRTDPICPTILSYAALGTFGAPLNELRVGDLERPGLIFQIGVAPNRIDVLTAIDGVTFSEAWRDRRETRYSDQTVPVISRHHLILNKRATGRPQDLLDAEELANG